MKDGVGVKEDPGINILGEHLVHEEAGGGAHPEHALHVLQTPRIGESHPLETE